MNSRLSQCVEHWVTFILCSKLIDPLTPSRLRFLQRHLPALLFLSVYEHGCACTWRPEVYLRYPFSETIHCGVSEAGSLTGLGLAKQTSLGEPRDPISANPALGSLGHHCAQLSFLLWTKHPGLLHHAAHAWDVCPTPHLPLLCLLLVLAVVSG